MPICSATQNGPSCLTTQLIVYKTYQTPVLAPNGCDLRTETRNIVMFNVNNPTLTTTGAVPDQNDPSDKNATLWLAPGELGRVTLRLYDRNRFDNVTGATSSIGETSSRESRTLRAAYPRGRISRPSTDAERKSSFRERF